MKRARPDLGNSSSATALQLAAMSVGRNELPDTSGAAAMHHRETGEIASAGDAGRTSLQPGLSTRQTGLTLSPFFNPPDEIHAHIIENLAAPALCALARTGHHFFSLCAAPLATAAAIASLEKYRRVHGDVPVNVLLRHWTALQDQAENRGEAGSTQVPEHGTVPPPQQRKGRMCSAYARELVFHTRETLKFCSLKNGLPVRHGLVESLPQLRETIKNVLLARKSFGDPWIVVQCMKMLADQPPAAWQTYFTPILTCLPVAVQAGVVALLIRDHANRDALISRMDAAWRPWCMNPPDPAVDAQQWRHGLLQVLPDAAVGGSEFRVLELSSLHVLLREFLQLSQGMPARQRNEESMLRHCLQVMQTPEPFESAHVAPLFALLTERLLAVEGPDAAGLLYLARLRYALTAVGAAADPLGRRLTEASNACLPAPEQRAEIFAPVLKECICDPADLAIMVNLIRELPIEQQLSLWSRIPRRWLSMPDFDERETIIAMLLDEFSRFPEAEHAELLAVAARVYSVRRIDDNRYAPTFSLSDALDKVKAFGLQNRVQALCSLAQVLPCCSYDMGWDAMDDLLAMSGKLPLALQGQVQSALSKNLALWVERNARQTIKLRARFAMPIEWITDHISSGEKDEINTNLTSAQRALQALTDSFLPLPLHPAPQPGTAATHAVSGVSE